MITSVMSWDLQKPRSNYQSSEEALVQKSSFKCPGARFTKTDKTRPVKNQTPSSNLNSPRTHMYSFLLPPSPSSFPAAFAKGDELVTVNGIIPSVSRLAAPRLVKENPRVMALLGTFVQDLQLGAPTPSTSTNWLNPTVLCLVGAITPLCQPLCQDLVGFAGPVVEWEKKAGTGSSTFLTPCIHTLPGGDQWSFFCSLCCWGTAAKWREQCDSFLLWHIPSSPLLPVQCPERNKKWWSIGREKISACASQWWELDCATG